MGIMFGFIFGSITCFLLFKISSLEKKNKKLIQKYKGEEYIRKTSHKMYEKINPPLKTNKNQEILDQKETINKEEKIKEDEWTTVKSKKSKKPK